MTKDETKASLMEDIIRYTDYVEADKRELQRAKLTLENNQRLLKLVQSQFDEIAMESSVYTLTDISKNLK